MKIKLIELIASEKSLNELSLMDLPVKVSYAIAKNTRKIAEEFKTYNETLTKAEKTVMEELFEKDKKGEFILSDKGGVDRNNQPIQEYTFKKGFTNKDWVEKINAIMNPLKESEIEVDIHKFKVSDLGDMKIKSSFIAPLWYMIDENEEKKA